MTPELKKGSRVDVAHHSLSPGDYGRDHRNGEWYCRTPNGHLGNLSAHEVTEHEDGTITVWPSILVTERDTENLRDVELWHGYLERGVWRSERELLREALKLAHEFVADPDKRAQVKVQLAMNGRPKLADMIDEAVRVSRALIALANAQPESTQQPTLLDVQDRIDRGDIEGARATFNAGIRFVPVEAPQQAVPAGCVECMQEASEVLSEERMPRGPLADELWGFSLMLRDNAAQATQQAVLDAYTCCAEIATHFKTLRAKEWRDKYGLGNGITIEAAILAARDALKDKP